MSIRAILLGLTGAAIVCGFTHMNDRVIRGTYMVGCSLPPSVFGALIFIILLNPVLRRIKRGLELRRAELGVAIAITLAACCIPSAGLMETFPNVVMVPHRHAQTKSGWQKEKVLDLLPADKNMLADPTVQDGKALSGYVQGGMFDEKQPRTQEPGGWFGRTFKAIVQKPKDVSHHIFNTIPWSAWTGTLAFWLPMVFCLWVGLIGLSMVLHKRWADHEKLPYPIASFVSYLLPSKDPNAIPFYKRRGFWVAAGVVMGIHTLNYLAKWYPNHVVGIPTVFRFGGFQQLFSLIAKGGGANTSMMFNPQMIFSIIGLAYLLPRKTSFSMGIGPFVYCLFAGLFLTYSNTPLNTTGWYEVTISQGLQAGVYMGVMLMVLYNGRHYYANVMKSSIGLKGSDEIPSSAIWGIRICMLAFLLLTFQLTMAGLDWQLSILLVIVLIVIFTVIGRISAETGYIFIQAGWNPAVFLVGLFGMRALGPSTAILIYLICTVIIMDTRESILGFLFNSFKVLDTSEVQTKKVFLPICIALVVGVAIAIPATLYVKYDQGVNLKSWAESTVPAYSFDEALNMKRHLQGQDVLDEAEAVSGFGRFKIRPSGKWIGGFGVGIAVFVLLSFAHLRFPWWPIHPCIMFLWSTYPGARFAGSFLMAALIKTIVVKYGGEQASQKIKPIMIGLIAADMMFGITSSVIGVIYYLVTDTPPPRFSVLV